MPLRYVVKWRAVSLSLYCGNVHIALRSLTQLSRDLRRPAKTVIPDKVPVRGNIQHWNQVGRPGDRNSDARGMDSTLMPEDMPGMCSRLLASTPPLLLGHTCARTWLGYEACQAFQAPQGVRRHELVRENTSRYSMLDREPTSNGSATKRSLAWLFTATS